MKTKRDMAGELFEATVLGHGIFAQLNSNRHVKEDDPRRLYVEIFTVKSDGHGWYSGANKLRTIFRFFVSPKEWEGIFIPNNGLTAGQAMKMIETFWDKRVCGSDPWGRKENGR